ncbi:RHS domain-containing protein [Endozoicomonas sp. SM1973]|uniref:RHS domain-containing protein n=1 Tax=Spartinivicinus marinus TaxID=2994442 RepID=A0A853I8Q8_9GAMM|nr:polymorphic toxin-type HINT domain-containing protein [Spartinivicinus marinus]MCX4024712.1 polymorphic toxin-type HINT domain-containing protein [Spartinivicinus marinus]NYZ66261.1 RHS domain-containing protein [Spartinivicinus marinus]
MTGWLRSLIRLGYCLLFLFSLLGGQLTVAAPGIILLEEEPRHTGIFRLKELDIWLQAKGSPARIIRTYQPGVGWAWNRRWVNLSLKKVEEEKQLIGEFSVGVASGCDTGPNTVSVDAPGSENEEVTPAQLHYTQWDYIVRDEVKYYRLPNSKRFGKGGTHIIGTETGYRWQNREGNWIEYDQTGAILKYGDAEGNEITLKKDGQGRIHQVIDKQERVLFTFNYIGDSGLVEYITDYTERKVQYHYQNGQLVKVTDVRGYDWQYTYNEAGHLSQRIDPENNITQYQYAETRVTGITRADGLTTRYHYDYDRKNRYYHFTIKTPTGKVIERRIVNGEPPEKKKKKPRFADGVVRSAGGGGSGGGCSGGGGSSGSSGGNAVIGGGFETVSVKKKSRSKIKEIYREHINGVLIQRVIFNAETNVRTIFDKEGKKTTIQDDIWGNPLEFTHADGTEEVFSYVGSFNYISSYVDRQGVKYSFSYDSAGRLTATTDAVGTDVSRSVSYSYGSNSDTNGSTVTTTYSGHNGANVSETAYYDDLDRLVKVKDGEGHITQYTTNVLGLKLTKTTPKGYIYHYEYDLAGNLIQETDPLGRTTQYVYDKAGNQIKTIEANKAETNYGHNALNEHITTTDATGYQLTRTIDRGKNQAHIKNGDHTSTIQFDSNGRVVLFTDAEANKVSYQYEESRLKKITYPNFEQQFKYNERRLVSHVDTVADGKTRTRRFQYDIVGQVTEEIDANNIQTAFKYDELGRVSQVTNAKGGQTTFEYNHLNQVIKVIDAEEGETRFSYDKDGLLTAETVVVASGQERIRRYSYDPDGNLKQSISAGGEKRLYHYDEVGQLIKLEVFTQQADEKPARVVELTYDVVGLLTHYKDNEVEISYHYSTLGELETTTVNYGPFSKTFTYGYNEHGQIQAYTTPEGVTYEYSYTPNGEFKSLKIPSVGQLIVNQYQWMSPVEITLPGGTKIKRTVNGFGNLVDNQLIDPAGNIISRQQYQHDAVGNIISRTDKNGTAQFSYNALYQLTGADYPQPSNENIGSGLPQLVDEQFGYDGVGNRTQYNDQTVWQYNQANQLVKQGDIRYRYDANGNLIEKSHGAKTTKFFYNELERLVRVEDGSGQVIARYGYNLFGHRLWKETNGEKRYFLYNLNGLAAEYDSSGQLIREYQFVPYSPWMTNPLFQRVDGQLYYFQTDQVGAPTRMVAANGKVVWSANYQSFGKAIINKAEVDTPLRFPGQYHDKETGLNHNYWRDYDPELGRYIESDPIGLGGGVNRYLFANANPIIKADPYGQAPIIPVAMAVGSAAAAAASRCFAACVAEAAIGAAASALIDWYNNNCSEGSLSSFGEEALSVAKECAGFCARPWNWFRRYKGFSKKKNPRKKSPCQCFIAGTLVKTKEGLKPIEEVEKGELVAARNDETAENSWQPVSALIAHPEQILYVTLTDDEGQSETYGTTEEHPFWVQGKGWVEASELRLGDVVASHDGRVLQVGGVSLSDEHLPTYNLEVANAHTYFIGELGAWVHNECKEVFNSIKDSPKYPKGFRARHNGTTTHTVKNKELLEVLRQHEAGKWQKVYKDGFDAQGNRISIHYFRSQSGKVFDVKTKNYWSN